MTGASAANLVVEGGGSTGQTRDRQFLLRHERGHLYWDANQSSSEPSNQAIARASLETEKFYVWTDLQIELPLDPVPELNQLLLDVLGLLHAPVERQLNGLRHDQLAARILTNRSPEIVLCDGQAAQTTFLGLEARCDARRAGAHDQHVHDVG